MTPLDNRSLAGVARISVCCLPQRVTPATTNAAGVEVPGTLVKVIFETGQNVTVKQAELED